MSNIIKKEEWYKKLLIDLKTIEWKGIVVNKWRMGKRILKDEAKFQRFKYGSKRIPNLSKDTGISTGELWRCVKFAQKYPYFNENSPAGRELSWREFHKKYLSEPREESKQLLLPSLNKDKYQIIYADPPWSYYEGGHKNQSQHYDGMSIEEICKINIDEYADDNCILFLWVTFPILNSRICLG